ncbi:hypothetical protein BC834DRAFT_902560 [Gloeopeniophorella convolvens]|nr:hypothetical protein BC834DRAFT_902560 [Gloeopeniophorella convolvens]
MISTMRLDIDHADEYVRNTTTCAFSVIASVPGIPSLLLFLKVICRSKKSWQAHHTGIRFAQQITPILGCAVLPYLRNLVDYISHGVCQMSSIWTSAIALVRVEPYVRQDEQQKVETMTALGLAAFAEAAAPYGIESFDDMFKYLSVCIAAKVLRHP